MRGRSALTRSLLAVVLARGHKRLAVLGLQLPGDADVVAAAVVERLHGAGGQGGLELPVGCLDAQLVDDPAAAQMEELAAKLREMFDRRSGTRAVSSQAADV